MIAYIPAMFALKGLFVIVPSRWLRAIDQQRMLFLKKQTHIISNGMKKEVNGTKLTDLVTMYNNFVPRDRQLDFLPPP